MSSVSGKVRGVRSPEAVAEAIRLRVASNPVDALREAKAAYRRARDEKHQANLHRRQSTAAMFRFQEFKRNLEAMDIEVIVESGPYRTGRSTDHQGPKEVPSDYSSNRDATE